MENNPNQPAPAPAPQQNIPTPGAPQPAAPQPSQQPQPAPAQPLAQPVQPITQPQPVAQPQPVVPPQPVVQPQPVMQPQPQNVAPVQTAAVAQLGAVGRKSKAPLLIGLIGGGVAVLVLLCSLAWMMFLSPSARSLATAVVFENAIADGNVNQAASYTDGSADAKAAVATAVTVTSGPHKMTNSTFKDNSRYVLFDFSNAKAKYARVIVDQEKGKWVVTSYVYSNSQLALIPTKSETTDTAAPQTDTAPADTTAPATAPATGTCLGPNDFGVFTSTPVDQGFDGRYTWYDSIFFNADVATYAYPDQMPDIYSKYKQFYNQNSSKQFSFYIQGQVYSKTPDDQLANQRAAKVQQDLVANGIPASHIQIQAPTNYGDSLGAGDSGSQNRSVNVTIESPDSCATSN